MITQSGLIFVNGTKRKDSMISIGPARGLTGGVA
jgi:hypothetical protein